MIRIAVGVLAILACSIATVMADDSDTASTRPPLSPDGPHIVWINDSTATVFYLCADTIAPRTYTIADTLRFHGFCDDADVRYAIPRHLNTPQDAIIADASRVFAVSDIHGEYEILVDILRKAGVIDTDRHWSWGDGHLVVVGDVFDRGDMVTECLWLIYSLEQEAAAHGGRVHMLLGNHEKMVLRGDLRYVNEKYTGGIAHKSRIPYDNLYGPDTEIGRWLRTKPTAIRINDVLFIHAGVPPRVLDESISLSELNDSVRAYLDLSPERTTFSNWPKYLFSGDGPLWYRGYFEEREDRYPLATQEYVDRTAAFYGVNTIVVGHTEIDSIESLFQGRVIAIDVPVDELGGLEGLLWEAGILRRVKSNGEVVDLK